MADKPIKPTPGSPGERSPPTRAPPRSSAAPRRWPSRKPVSPQKFFQEAWVELKKTTWPNQDVLTKSTTVVLALVVAVAIWVGGLDFSSAGA